jgi:uncharacterized protein (TIGR00725 family)
VAPPGSYEPPRSPDPPGPDGPPRPPGPLDPDPLLAGRSAVARPHVAVIGTSQPTAAEESAAFAVGAGLGRAGAVLVSGGRGGVMAESCRGARTEGATTIGILPGLDRREANPWVEVAIPTGLGELRNGLVVRCADALIAVGGAYGTLSEIALALQAGKPVIGLATWHLERGGAGSEAASAAPARGVPASPPTPGIIEAADPADAVRRALAAIAS